MTTLSRRSLLSKGLAGISLAATAPHFLSLSSRVLAGEAPGDRILVVLQLSGGNDGLSMLVPVTDPAYTRARRATLVRDTLKLSDDLGLHPELKATHRLFGEGQLAIVQGVSYPNPTRSHFESMDIWHTADPRGRGVSTGWLGRAIDACCPDVKDPNLVVNIGKAVPYALEARVHKPVSFESPESYRWAGNPRDREEFEGLNEAGGHGDEISWLHRVAVDARASSERIRAAAAGYQPKAEYPRSQLASDLRTVAALIHGGLGTRVYYVSFGGFDTHNAQQNRYGNLMRELDGAVGAFVADLKAQGQLDRVLIASFSEFGRRVAENASGGTDHGVAGPMWLLGGRVKGGLHGKQPGLDDLDDNGDLKMQVDFRSVYAEILDDWLQVPPAKILPPFPRIYYHLLST
jgi:uncharacterized protein (DUF1501 family)